MKEKSQIEAMRAALRGDLDRARARREADPWRTPEPVSEAVREPEPAPDAAPEPEPGPVLEAVPEPEPVVEAPAPEPVRAEPEPPVEPAADEPRRGFLARLLRRS